MDHRLEIAFKMLPSNIFRRPFAAACQRSIRISKVSFGRSIAEQPESVENRPWPPHNIPAAGGGSNNREYWRIVVVL